MREGVSGYLVCFLWLKSNSTVWGMCVVFYSPMFGHIYMKGERGPCICGQSPAGGGVVRHPSSVGFPSSSLPLVLRLCLLVFFSYVAEVWWSMGSVAVGWGGFSILLGVWGVRCSVPRGPRSALRCT